MFSTWTPAKKFKYLAVLSLVFFGTVFVLTISAAAGGVWTTVDSKLKNSPQQCM